MEKKKKESDFTFYWDMPEKENTFSLLDTRPVNITETEKEIVVKAEMKGFKRNEININVTENTIEIVAQKKEEKIEKSENHFKQERSSGSIRKAFTLPKKVNPEKAEAKLESGILVISIPKIDQDKKKKRNLEIK